MVGWHHQLNGHEFEQALGVGNGQGRLVCCSPWGCEELDTTKRLHFDFSLSRIGEGNGNPLQYCCLKNSMDSGASIQLSHSVVSNSLRPHELQTSLSITNSWSPPKPRSIESVMPPNHLILCRPLLLPLSIFPSIRVFSNESVLHIRWPKY